MKLIDRTIKQTSPELTKQLTNMANSVKKSGVMDKIKIYDADGPVLDPKTVYIPVSELLKFDLNKDVLKSLEGLGPNEMIPLDTFEAEVTTSVGFKKNETTSNKNDL